MRLFSPWAYALLTLLSSCSGSPPIDRPAASAEPPASAHAVVEPGCNDVPSDLERVVVSKVQRGGLDGGRDAVRIFDDGSYRLESRSGSKAICGKLKGDRFGRLVEMFVSARFFELPGKSARGEPLCVARGSEPPFCATAPQPTCNDCFETQLTFRYGGRALTLFRVHGGDNVPGNEVLIELESAIDSALREAK